MKTKLFSSIVILFSLIHVLHAQNFVAGNAMVLLDKNITVKNLCLELESTTGFEFQAEKRLSQSINLWLISFNADQIETPTVLSKIEREEGVILAQLNHTNLVQRSAPNDAYFENQWAFENNGTNGGSGTSDIQAIEAWDIATGGLTVLGDTIVVAVIDGGFDVDHEDLFANMYINHQEIPGNGIDDDGNGYIDDVQGWDFYSDDNTIPLDNHGTHVAGTIGARGNNQIGVTGVNWNVKLLPLAGSSSLESTVVAAYGYVLDMRKKYNQTNGSQGAYIVSTNSSFGVDYGDPAAYPIWCAMYDSLGYEGVLSAGATANLPIDIDVYGDVPTACSSNFLLSVTNSTSSDVRNSGAAWGDTTIDIAAPGSYIYSVKNYDNYGNNTGTSMATPHVAGAVGLMYAAACEQLFLENIYSPDSLALIIRRRLLNQGVDTLMSLQNQVASQGRLNLFKALKSVSDSCLRLTAYVDSSNCDSCSGQIDLKLVGAVGATSYNWSTGDTTQNLSGLCAGVYSVTVTDDLDTMISSFVVSDEQGPNLDYLVSNVSCFGSSDGEISISSSIPFYWYDGTNDSLKAGLGAGTYFVEATDSISGCSTIYNIEVGSPYELMSINSTFFPFDTTSGAFGQISISAVGGTAPYNIVWTDDTSTSFTRTELPQGTYSFTITDTNGCIFSDEVFIGIPAGVERPLKERIIIYPNPTSGELIIESENQLYSVDVYNLHGSLLAHKTTNNENRLRLDLGEFVHGVYLIKIESSNQVSWSKIVRE